MTRTHLNTQPEKYRSINMSRVFLTAGCILTIVGFVTCVLSLTLPYWIYVSETMETTVAGLTDDTDVEYYYGLLRTCLVMKATHLDRDECTNRSLDGLKDWELVTFATLIVSSSLLITSIITAIVNLRCWNKLRLIVIATVTSILAGVSSAVGVTLYQTNASVLVLDLEV